MTHQTPLTVYKASAGSGKTFTLAVEYIKLLIEDPLSYRNILAVTFTNKATEEMKMRILSQLNGLAHGYEDSKDYMDKITRELGVSEEHVQERAGTALRSLIHDYTAFRVETIDKFFQRVLKNLAKELDLTANLRIELNDKQVEQLAVDSMIESLTSQDIVLNWLMGYILENIQEDKSWNIIKQVKRFGENIFKDTYKNRRKRLHKVLSKPDFFDQYKEQMQQLRDDSRQTMVDHAKRFFDATTGYIREDFAYGINGVYHYFEKLLDGTYKGGAPGARVVECMTSADKWVTRGAPHRNEIIALAQSKLMDILRDAEHDRISCYRKYKSATVTLAHLNQLRLLGHIEKKVRDLNSSANRFLLSDTQEMLNGLIDDSDTPFIFEKIGARLQHIMIDEFQDTGALQWNNFKILLNECMDQGTSNLIVGDVKQSIYRWRSGDWKLLNGITGEFNDDESMIKVKPLDTNYRSRRKVIEFNNSFFTSASKLEYERLKQIVGADAEQMQKAYSDICQHIPAWKGDEGYVHVELMEKKKFGDQIMKRLTETIQSLLDHGVAQRDIAILARNNSEIVATAQYFQANHPDIHIVSDEAFKVGSSLAVNLILTALRCLVNETEVLHKAILAKTYQNDILQKGLDDDAIMLHTNVKDPYAAFTEWLPEGFRDSAQLASLRALPLTDLIESLYNIFQLDLAKGQSPYLCTLYDIVAEHLKDNTSDIGRFLQAWEDGYYKKTIHGDDVNGIRMVTIHKSKGLEYDNVIIPFCDWELEKHMDNIVWCEAADDPFKQLPVLPINYSRNSMIDTTYEEEYKTEHLQNSVDNLNLLYVAFTRARTRLIVFGVSSITINKGKRTPPAPQKDTHARRCLLVEQALVDLDRRRQNGENSESEQVRDFTLDITDEDDIIFDYGDCFQEMQVHQEKATSNIFLQKEEGIPFKMQSYPVSAAFRQSNNSRLFTTSEEKELLRMEYIQRGNLLHNIFSRLKTTDDLENVLRELQCEGILYDEVTPEELRQMISQALDSPRIREWFSPKWKLHNECSVISRDPETGQVITLRPDRVMSNGKRTVVVDFKFGMRKKEHADQVRTYMRLLREMGHPAVEGYLWYVSTNRTEKVKE